MSAGMRVGIGWDVHRLVKGRRLVLGGVHIPGPKGLLGHSDGDALLHAVADAILGAAGLGDIGERFPPSDPKWKGLDSRVILREALAAAAARGLAPSNLDVVVVAEAPKLGLHKAALRASLSAALGLPADAVNVKAKTAEGLGAVGAGEAIEVHAVVLLAPAAKSKSRSRPTERKRGGKR